ncbi:MAG: hypothetical protein JSU86_06190 [Phycisphaerales bacterium]|nr:MAG: hypothetical protein JSU86_06190 [Phycisphaerales bacterium]
MDKDIERLIVRSLDGELGEDEQLQLNRELIRNPEAQRLMEQYKQIDELAGVALDHALGCDRIPLDPAALPGREQSQRVVRYHRGWWLVPGAIAAALLAIVVAQFSARPPAGPALADRNGGAGNTVVPVGRVPRPTGIMRNASTAVRRSTGRDVFGVVGEDGNIYWIEVDSTKTFRRPRPRPGARVPTEDM